MVTKVWYQKGAKKFANFYGINLNELRLLTDVEFDNEAVDFEMSFSISTITIKEGQCLLDDDWLKKNGYFPIDK